MAITPQNQALVDALKEIAKALEDQTTLLSGQTVMRDRSPVRAAIVQFINLVSQ